MVGMELQTLPADDGQTLVAKRTAIEEPDTLPKAKRIKDLQGGSTQPAAKTLAIARRIPILEKVC